MACFFKFLTLSPKAMPLAILQIYQSQQLMFFMEVIPWVILFTGSIACHSHVPGCFVNIHNHYFLSFFFVVSDPLMQHPSTWSKVLLHVCIVAAG